MLLRLEINTCASVRWDYKACTSLYGKFGVKLTCVEYCSFDCSTGFSETLSRTQTEPVFWLQLSRPPSPAEAKVEQQDSNRVNTLACS